MLVFPLGDKALTTETHAGRAAAAPCPPATAVPRPRASWAPRCPLRGEALPVAVHASPFWGNSGLLKLVLSGGFLLETSQKHRRISLRRMARARMALEKEARSLLLRGAVRSRALEVLGKEGTSCAAPSVVTCAHTWRPSSLPPVS